MNRKLLFVAASTLMTVGASAVEWEKPIPEHKDLVFGDTVYVYNRDSKGFFCAGNKYGTHASIGPKGFMCIFAETEKGVTFRDSVESVSKWMNVYAHTTGGDCWVDWADNGDIYFDLVKQADGSYKIYSKHEDNQDKPLGIDVYTGTNLTNVIFTDPEFSEINSINWWIVSKAAYNEYEYKNNVYDAALALNEKIAEAKELELDASYITAATNVYENTAATLDEMNAANETLLAAINDYKENLTTPNNPKDLTEQYIPDADFESNKGAGVWQRTHSATNYQTENTANKLGDETTFLEAWNKDPYSGKEYVKITGLPNGVYEFTLSAATNNKYGCYVYAGSSRTEVLSDVMTPYTVYARVTDGNLEVGLDMPEKIQNWVGIDDAKLLYLGNTIASYSYWMKNNVKNSAEYDEDETFASVEEIQAYNKLREENLDEYTTVDELLAFNDKFTSATKSLNENIEAYKKFTELCAKIVELQDLKYSGGAADDLFDSYDCGEIANIVTEKSLSTEEMLAKCEEISKTIEVVKKTCLIPGFDCTNLITNANFTEGAKGWSHDETMAGIKEGGKTENPNAERWNDNFDIYQEITGIPNGVYELKVQAFYRPTGDTKSSYKNFKSDKQDEILTSIYVNTLSTPVKNVGEHTYSITDDAAKAEYEEVEDGVFCPNTMASCSDVFSNGDYENVVRGIVTDGVLRVGIKSKGTVEGRWSIWDNFRLKYLGSDEEAVKVVTDDSKSEYDHFQKTTTYAYNGLKNAVDEAYAKLLNASGEEAFTALEEFVKVLEVAKENEALYTELSKQNTTLGNLLESVNVNNALLNDEATKLYQNVSAEIEDMSLSTAEAAEKLDKVCMYCARLRMPDYSNEAEYPVDFTSVIVNPSFEESENESENLNGWVNEGSIKMKAQKNDSFAKTDNKYCEKWHASGTINFHQTLKYLPNGYYTLNVDAFCEAEEAVIFANDKEIEFSNKNASTEKTTEAITVQVTDGVLKFGVRVSLTDKTWVCVDNFQLFYLGTNTPAAIDEVATEASTDAPAEFFTVSGSRSNGLQKGLNIVRKADGTVKKVFVK